MARRVLVVASPESIAVEQQSELVASPDEVVIRPVCCGLCGTALELLGDGVDPGRQRN